MTFSSTDTLGHDEQARSRAHLSRLVAALLLGLAAVTGVVLESSSSVLTDEVQVSGGVTTAPSFASTPTPHATRRRRARPTRPSRAAASVQIMRSGRPNRPGTRTSPTSRSRSA